MTNICLTGATGFIGKNLLNELKKNKDFTITALSRKISPEVDGAKKGNVIWKRCNAFSLIDCENASKGCDILIYLIHSMLPSSALTQGKFNDFDLYLADNFSKACKINGIKKIIYLSGIIPEVDDLSEHLESRLEVEKTLAQYGNDVTALRAGLIVGKNGSSFKILERLIKRLPALICPSWTRSKTQPIDLSDVLASIHYCIDHPKDLSCVYDIAGPDIMSYKEMLATTAKMLGVKRAMIDVPFFSTGLSRLWVSKVSSTPSSLVYPLVESLKHSIVATPNKQLILKDYQYKKFEDSLKDSLSDEPSGIVHQIMNMNASFSLRLLENVISIQRIKAESKSDVHKISELYFSWLPRIFSPFIKVKVQEGEIFFLLFGNFLLLKLTKFEKRSSATRLLYYITGGILAREKGNSGRMEFRWVDSSSCVLIALLDFRPSLPWFIYKFTQAPIHLWAMKSFQKYLRSVTKKEAKHQP